MHEIVKYFILTEIRLQIVNLISRSDRGIIPRDLAHSRCMEQCMVADLSARLGSRSAARARGQFYYMIRRVDLPNTLSLVV